MITSYRDKIAYVAASDAELVLEKDKVYGGSWKRRGGIGAYMMLARKWDRLEEYVDKHAGWDIFRAVEEDTRTQDGVIDDIRDLRRYLLLVEAELIARGAVPAQRRMTVPKGGTVVVVGDREIHTITNARVTPTRLMFLTGADITRKERDGATMIGAEEVSGLHQCNATMIVGGETQKCVRVDHDYEGNHVYASFVNRCLQRVGSERCLLRHGHAPLSDHLAAFYVTDHA